MPISLLERCEQAVAAASDPDQRAGAHVELSLAQARLGRLDDARRTLNATRGLILAASPCALRVRAAIAEATLCFLTDREDETIDILWRAHADASAHGALQQAARAQCAAELAFCFQYRGRVLEAITLAAEAWRLARDDDHSTRYTALLTVAILHQEAGLIATAMPLYGAALKQARAAQDDIAVSSVLTQTAIVQAVEVCIERAKGREDTEALRQAVVGMRSAIEFSRTSLNKVPHALEHCLLASLLVMRGEHGAALVLLDEFAERLPAEGYLADHCVALCDRGLCLLAGGHVEKAVAAGRAAVRDMQDSLSPELRGLILARYASILRAAGVDGADAATIEAWRAFDAHERSRKTAASLLSSSLDVAQWQGLDELNSAERTAAP